MATTRISPPYNASHLASAQARLIQQYKNKTNIGLFLTALAGEFQAVEDMYDDLRWLRAINAATGIQLDHLGYLVGGPFGCLRNNMSDEPYRARLQAQVLLNISSGSPEEIYAIAAAMLQLTPGYTLSVLESFLPPAFVLRIGGVAITNAADIATVLKLAKDCGVQMNSVEYTTDTDANSFVLESVAGFLNSGVIATATALPLGAGQAAKFLIGQSVKIDAGTAVEETRTISAINTSTDTLTVAALTNAHDPNATVQLTTSTGLGYGDTGNAATGGSMAGATA